MRSPVRRVVDCRRTDRDDTEMGEPLYDPKLTQPSLTKRRLPGIISGLLPRSPFGRRASILGAGALANQVLQLLAVPIIGRLYGPAAFGNWALLQSIAAVGATIAGLRYELAVVVADDETEAAYVAAAQMASNLLVSGLLFLLILLFRPAIAHALGYQELGPWLYAIPLLAFFSSLLGLVTNWLVRAKEFTALARMTLAQSGLTVALQIAAAFILHRRMSGLILGGVIGQVVPFGVMLSLARSGKASVIPHPFYVRALWAAARKHASFPAFMTPWSLVESLRERGITILLGLFANAKIVGFYSIALRLVWAPQGLASSSLSTVLFQHAAEQEDISKVAPVVLRVNLRLVRIAVPAFVFLAWWSSDILGLVLGNQWRGAGIYVSIMCAPAFCLVLQGWLVRLLSVIRCQHIGFMLEAGYSAVALTVFGYLLASHRSVVVAVAAFALTTVLYQVVFLVKCYQLCSFPLKGLRRTAAESLGLGFGAAAVFACISPIPNRTVTMSTDLFAMLLYYLVVGYRQYGLKKDSEDNRNREILS